MRKSKILIIGKLPPPYIGPTLATEIILSSKLKEEFDLIHLDTSDHREYHTLGALDFWNFYLAFKHYLILIWIIISRQPSLVYMPIGQTTISYFRDAPFILIAKLFGRNVICHLRGSNFQNWYSSLNFITKSLVYLIHSLVDGQVVLGKNLKYLFTKILPDNKIFVVSNGANYKFVKRKNYQSKIIRILFLSNFKRNKGLFDLLKSIPYVYSDYSNVEFIFAGSWGNEKIKEDFMNYLEEHPVLPITVKGIVYGSEKFILLASSDIFVLPSYNEGFPWVIIEAMASSLPIITTNQGAIREAVIDGINGYIVEKQNPKQIAEKISKLIGNPVMRRQMGEESRRLYLRNFTEKNMIEQLNFCFRTVLKMNGSKVR